MLSRVNAEFAAREAELPGLATLLDPAAVAERLRAVWPEVREVTLDYIRHKSGGNSLVLYMAETALGPRRFFARAFTADAGGKLDKARRLADANFAGLNAVVFAFPNDPDLPSLARLAHADQRAGLLSRVLKNDPARAAGALADLAYKPGRRYVARLDVNGVARAVVKFHGEAEFAAKSAIAKRISGNGEALITPRPLGASTRHCAIAYAWIDGAAFDRELAGTGVSAEAAAKVGAVIAALHGAHPHGLPSRSAEGAPGYLLGQAAAIGAIVPGAEAAASDLARTIAGRLRAIEPRRRLLHGDLSPAQVVLSGERAALIDLDEAHVGDPGVDIGHFFAELHRGALSERWRCDAAATCAAGFLEGYASFGGDEVRDLDVYVALGLMMLALEPFRRLAADWPGEVAAIVERAVRLAEGSADPLSI